MAEDRKDRHAPQGWPAFRTRIRYRWAAPFYFIEWMSQWASFVLGKLSILELLEYCGSFSVLVAVIFYFVEAPERQKMKHYQAWQVINTAQGKGGSGGRIDAMRDLNEDSVPLVGIDVSDAFLQGVELRHADLHRGRFDSSDLRNADLRQANLASASMTYANLRQADLSDADVEDVDLSNADLTDADLRGVNLKDANFEKADLRGVNLDNVSNWKEMRGARLANIHGIRNAPDGFAAWAISQGAVDAASDDAWNTLQNQSSARTQPSSRP